jgi:serine/threonine-protein kinase
MDAALPPTLGAAYRVERPLGEGGMATVYLATDLKHDRLVALKVLRRELAAAIGAERFRREIRIAAGLTHPHILPLYDSAATELGEDAPLYFVMPYVEGDTLRARLASGPLPIDEALRIAIEVADALDYAHRHGIVHRDIKPENILLLERHAVVTDFGIAHAVGEASDDRLTQTGIVLGTPAYFSPEQLDGAAKVDGRSDVFSLTAVLYEMLTGDPAFGASTTVATMARVAAGSPAPLAERRADATPEIVAAVERGFAVDRERRFQSAGELANALRAALASLPSTTAGRPVRRRARAPWIAAAALVATVGVVAVPMWRNARSTEADVPILAILPFATAPGDTANAYLGVGIAEQLLDALSDVPGLRVTSRTSSFALGPSPNVKEIGERLGATAVLEGGVTRVGNRLHVSARLIDPVRDTPLWSQRYDEQFSDVSDVQERIAHEIVDKLRVRLASDSATIMHRRSASAEAHDLVLRARYLMRRNTRAGMLAAVGLLSRAEALDSTYAEVAATQAQVYQLLAVFADQSRVPGAMDMTPGEGLRRSREAAVRAVRLDSLSSSAHAALGAIVFRYDWDWALAERELRRAIALNPTSAQTYVTLARVLRSMGRFGEARRAYDQSLALSGERTTDMLSLARIAYFERDFPRAEREMRNTNRSNRTWRTWYADAVAESGRLAEAESILAAPGADSDDPQVKLRRATVLARMGRMEEARAQYRAASDRAHEQPILDAGARAALGDTAEAIDVIERAVADHDPLVVDLAVEPRLDPLRSHPRFAAILARLRFPPVR